MDLTPDQIETWLQQLQQVTQRLVVQSSAMNSLAEFVLQNLPAKEGGGAPALMKFIHNTWMPIAEIRFPDAVGEDGAYQAAAYRAALRHAKGRGVAVDVGANIGLWTRPMVHDFELVHCFEPQWLARACLVRNVSKPNVVLWPFALGDAPGEVMLKVPEIAVGGAMIGPPDEVIASWSALPLHEEAIRVVTLDSIGLGRVDLLKIDVQGYEAKVLEGAGQTLRESNPVIVCEAGGKLETRFGMDVEAPIKLLVGLGYEVAERVGKNVVLVR